MGEPAYQLPEEDQPDIRPDLRSLEGGGSSTPRASGHLNSVPTGDDENDGASASPARHLRAIEGGAGKNDSDADSGESDYGPSAADDIRGKLGRGYSKNDKGKGSLWSRMSGGKMGSKAKKKLAIAGALAGGSLLGSILVFFLMLPLKIESLVTNLGNHFGAASSQAVGDESSHLLNRWIVRDILPNLGKGTCHNTISSGCVSVDRDTGPLGKMYNGWKQGKLEQKLATRYDIVLGKRNGQFYIDFPGGNASIKASDEAALRSGKTDIFTLAEKDQNYHKLRVTRNEIRTTINEAVKSETLYNRVYDRFQLGRYLERKYGIKRCIIACNLRDKFTDSKADKKKFAKAVIIERVVKPMSANYAYLMGCLLQSETDCNTNQDQASSGDEERTSSGERKVQSLTVNLAAKIGVETAGELAQKASAIADEGLQAYLTRIAVTQVIGHLLGTGAGEVSGEAATKAIPFVGWIILIAQIEHAAQTVGPMIKDIGYAIKAAGAVSTYYTYASAASEMKSGHVDATELGSLSSALGSNLSGSTDDRSDATQTPLYSSLNNTGSASTALAAGGTAYAATTTPSSASTKPGTYVCNNGKAPTDLVCPEENFAAGNDIANKITSTYNAIFQFVPFHNEVISFINFLGNLPGKLISTILKHVPLDGACGVLPYCNKAKDFVESHAADLLGWIMDKVIANPITDNMSGGRIYDMMAAGADVSSNQSCQVLLGCAKVDNQTAANIRNSYLATQKASFESKPFFARMFSTDTPYSLVSRVALTMPSSTGSMRAQTIASLSHNPISRLGSMLGNILYGNSVFAAQPAAKDPFGVTQMAYASVPDNPDVFWEQKCQGGPGSLATYDPATQKLDVTDWLNAQKPDPDTGQSVATVTNPCLLIYNTIIAAGAKYDASLLPPGSLIGSDTTGNAGSKFRIASFNMRVHTTPDQNQVAVDNMKNNGFDVVGMQELSHVDLFDTVKTKLQSAGYDIYPQNFTGTWDMNSTAITWNTAKFELIKTDSMTYPAGDKATPARIGAPTTSPIVWLKDIGTGQEIIVTNAHTFAFGKTAQFDGPALRSQAAKVFTAKIQALQSEGLPIFFTGDFNEGYGPSGTAYCMLETQGLMVSPFVSNPADYCKAGGQTGEIDHILTSPGITGTAQQLTGIGPRGPDGVFPNLGTDHLHVPFSDIVIAGSAGGGPYNVATFNVQGASHSLSDWQQRMDQSLNVISSNHLDISGMQELQQRQRQYLLDHVGNTYDIYPSTPIQAGHELEDSIIWDKSKFTLVDGGVQPNLKYFGGSDLNAPWVKLKDNTSGQQFYVLNTHDPAHPENDYWRYHDALEHVAFITQLQKDNLPIIFTGDFNSGYSLRTSENITYQNKNENLTYCILTNNGLMNDAFDLSVSRAVHCPNPGNANEVDHVFLSPKVQVNKFTKVPPSQNGSDVHSTVIVNINFPGTQSGGGTPTPGAPGKDFVGRDGFGSGWCTQYVDYILGRHAAHYTRGGYPDGKDFANYLKSRFGYAVNNSPAVHAVVSFPGPPYGFVGTRFAGHVALVGQVNADGSIVVEESNFNVSMHYGTHKVSAAEAKTLTYAHTEMGWH